jgi:hypothetical protein
MPISAPNLDFASGVLPHRRLHLQQNASMATMSVRQWLGTPAKMAGLRETLSRPLASREGSQRCAPSERWGPRSNKPLRERYHAMRVALAPPQNQQRLLQTSSPMKPTPASIAYPQPGALVSTVRPHMATEEALAGGERP